MSNKHIHRATEYFAISIAGICFVHCLLVPVMLVLFPLISSIFIFKEIFHQLLLLLIIPSSAAALFLGCRKHKDFNVLFLGLSGLFILLVGAFIVTEDYEIIPTLIGSSIMITAHIRNFKLCSKNNCKH